MAKKNEKESDLNIAFLVGNVKVKTYSAKYAALMAGWRFKVQPNMTSYWT